MSQVIGHRGAAAYAPENTLAAFQKAYDLGCRFIEFDVMLSADGEPFIIHDDALKRTTNGQGKTGKVSSAYLNSLDAGAWYSKAFLGEKIPTLHDAIQWLNSTDVHANIEIKPYPGQSEETTQVVMQHIQTYWSSDKKAPLVSSFDLEALRLARQLSANMPLGLLMDKWQSNVLDLAEELRCVSVNLSRRAATKARVSSLKEAGYLVYVYTTNKKQQAFKLFDIGVDAVFSDHPDLLRN